MTDKLFCNRKSFVWSNYYVLENSENKNQDINKVTIKFDGHVFLHWYLKNKKNCKYKYHNVKVKSFKWQSTLGLLLKPGPGPWKTWIIWD